MNLNFMMLGMIIMASFVASLFFLRYWRQTRDRFFLFFALSFLLDATGRVILGLQHYSDEQEPFFYLFRLAAFSVILIAIIDKNWRRRPGETK